MTGARVVNDDYQLAAGETFTEPDRSLYPPYVLSADGTSWSGLTADQYKQSHPQAPTLTIDRQVQVLTQSVNALGMQMAQIMKN